MVGSDGIDNSINRKLYQCYRPEENILLCLNPGETAASNSHAKPTSIKKIPSSSNPPAREIEAASPISNTILTGIKYKKNPTASTEGQSTKSTNNPT